MARLIGMASGKGGVGKSVVSANVAAALARTGARVVLADLDCGGSNAHTLLGLKNTHAGVGNYFEDKLLTVNDLLVDSGVPGLAFLPGDNLMPGAASMPFLRRRKLVKELAALDADWVVVDLGAGAAFSTVDVYLACHVGFLVTVPEPTAVLNAYSFIKTAVYRLASQAFKPRSEERAAVHAYFCRPAVGDEGPHGLEGLYAALGGSESPVAQKVAKALSRVRPQIVVNMVRETAEGNLAARLRQVAARQLDVRVAYIGLCPWDEGVRASVVDRRLAVEHQADRPFARAIKALAVHIVETGAELPEAPLDGWDDLEGLLADFPDR